MTPIDETGRQGIYLPDDLRLIIHAAFDLAFYRTVEDPGGLPAAVYHELQHRVKQLPEAKL